MSLAYAAFAAIGISVTLVLAALRFAYKYGQWQGEVNSDRASFKDFMKEIRSDIKKILERLPVTTIASGSPIRLTGVGLHISGKIKATEWAASEAEKLLSKTEGKDPLEIQEIAFQYARDFKPSKELLQKMRISAFEGGVGMEGVRDVLGVELRDVLLEKSGIHPSSLDSEEDGE